MEIRKMDKNALESLSLEEIAYSLIKEDKQPKPTQELFREICNLLEYGDEEYESQIADFFTSLTIDKRFILINSINWDLRENHAVKIVINHDEVDEIEEDDETDKFNEEVEDIEGEHVDTDEIDIDIDLDEEKEEYDDLNDMDIIEEDHNLDE